MKPVRFSRHAREQMELRGASEHEVLTTIRTGRRTAARAGRLGFRRDFAYGRAWGGRIYATKQILAIVMDGPDEQIVVTVYTFYF